jgi:hypothetical protein
LFDERDGTKARAKLVSEHQHQAALFEWAHHQERVYPELSLMFAIPNGSYKSKAAAAKFKAEGLKSGVPDVCLPVARGRYSSLFIEMKDGNKKPTENQVEWLTRLGQWGNCARICQSVDDAIKTLKWYLSGAV